MIYLRNSGYRGVGNVCRRSIWYRRVRDRGRIDAHSPFVCISMTLTTNMQHKYGTWRRYHGCHTLDVVRSTRWTNIMIATVDKCERRKSFRETHVEHRMIHELSPNRWTLSQSISISWRVKTVWPCLGLQHHYPDDAREDIGLTNTQAVPIGPPPYDLSHRILPLATYIQQPSRKIIKTIND